MSIVMKMNLNKDTDTDMDRNKKKGHRQGFGRNYAIIISPSNQL